MGFITGDKIESWAQSQNKVSVTAVISVISNISKYKGMKKISIGIDFSKKTFDATVLRREDDRFQELGYNKFNNDSKGFREFEKWVKNTLKPTPEAKDKSSWIFCGEHTGVYSIGLCDYLAKKKYFMWLESALVIHRKCGIVREKNDRIDSSRIARYALTNYSDEIKAYSLDSQDMKKLKSLYAAHVMLTKDKVAKNNQLKSGALDDSPCARKLILSQLDSVKKTLNKIDREIEKLLKESEEFSHTYEILKSFKGVGFVTIAALTIKTRNFQNMTDSKELGCYIGVVPHRKQSGTSIDKPARTSRYRDGSTNALITACVNSAIVHDNPVIRPYYDRLVARGVHPYKAKNNCKFKVINVLLAMVRNHTPFDIEKHAKSKKNWGTAV